MEDSKPILKGGTGTPYLAIFNSNGNPIFDPKTKLPIGTYVSDFWYEYREEESDECEITLDCDNPDILVLPDLRAQSVLVLQWGWIFIDGTSYQGPIRKVMIRDYQSDFNENGTRVVLKCTDLVAILKNKPADYTNKLFGMWLENNIAGKFTIGITDFEVKEGLVVATPWNQAIYGNGQKARIQVQSPSVTPQGEFEGEEIFKSGDDTSINQKFLEDKDKYYVGDEKLVNYRMLQGTDRTILAQLKSFAKLQKGTFMVDTRDDKISVHTYNFNQEPILSYTYAGGNGELLSASIKTEKKAKKTSVAQSSTVNPKTKEINTNLQQSFLDVDAVPEYLRRPEDSTKDMMNAGRRSLKGYPEYNDDPNQVRQQKINSAQDYKSTQEDLNRNYQITPDDVQEALSHFYEDFVSKKDAYQNDPNANTLLDLIKTNSLTKHLVSVTRPVIYEVDPYKYGKTGNLSESLVGDKLTKDTSLLDNNYGNANQVAVTSSTFSNNEGFNSIYSKGNLAIRNNPSIIVIGETPNRETHTREEDFGTNRYNYVRIIADTEMQVEVDGATIMSSATPEQLQKVINQNHLNANGQKQLVANIKILGRPELQSSRIVELKNISALYSGLWYTKKVRHQFNSAGYITTAEMIPRGLPKLSSDTTAKVSPAKGLPNWKQIKEVAKAALEQGYTPQEALSDYMYAIQQKAALDENFANKTQVIETDSEDLKQNKGSSKVKVSSNSDSVNLNDLRIKERENLSK